MVDDPRRWRQLTLWLHVLTSVGWMALAVVLLALLVLARTDGVATAFAATAMAAYLDIALLAPLANASAATGLMLSMATAWGLAQHRWVLAKFAFTLVQLYLGIFVLSDALHDAEATTGRPATTLVVGTRRWPARSPSRRGCRWPSRVGGRGGLATGTGDRCACR
jgi:hypothetical protein